MTRSVLAPAWVAGLRILNMSSLPWATRRSTELTKVSRSAALVRFLVDRRVHVSMVLFAVTLLVNRLVFAGTPRDVTHLSDPLVILSMVAILAGLVLRSWAAGALRKQRVLATGGPYAWVRNPLYVGSFLMMVGFCTLLLEPPLIAAMAVPVAIMYWLAVRDEEGLLAELFPDAWREYAARVPRFIPWPFTSPAGSGWSLNTWRLNEEYNAWVGSGVALAILAIWSLL